MPLTEGECHVKLGRQGRVVIPVAMRRVLGLEQGDELIARIDEGRLILERPDNVLARLQARVKAAFPPDVSLVDELIRERRREAARELEDP